MTSFLPGQYIHFAIESQTDFRYGDYVFAHIRQGMRKISTVAARFGHPEMAREIADLNGIRSTDKILPIGMTIKLPGNLGMTEEFSVLAGDTPPTIVEGYAGWDTIDRPQRVGLTVFRGYPPVQMSVPIRFENYMDGDGAQIEKDIRLLERMAGRGVFPGASTGQPPIVRLSTLDKNGRPMQLIPSNYQWFKGVNESPPLWVITGIDWDSDSLRNDNGERVRQLATVTVTQYTTSKVLINSATQRAHIKVYTNQPVGGFKTP